VAGGGAVVAAQVHDPSLTRSAVGHLGRGRCCDYGLRMQRIGAALIDIDGVLTVSWQLIAARSRRWVGCARRRCRWPWPRTPPPGPGVHRGVVDRAGFAASAGDILTAPNIAAACLAEHGCADLSR